MRNAYFLNVTLRQKQIKNKYSILINELLISSQTQLFSYCNTEMCCGKWFPLKDVTFLKGLIDGSTAEISDP